MKLQEFFSRIKKDKIWIAFLLLLSIFAFTNFHHQHLSKYLLQSIEEATISLAFLLEIKMMLASSSHIPLIGGSISQAQETVQEVVKYLTWSDIIITGQLILLKLSKTIIFKIGLGLGLCGALLSSSRAISLKLVVILLLINPGLPAYLMITKHISKEVKLDNASGLHNQIEGIHKKYKEKEKERNEKEARRNQAQLEKAESKGKIKVGGLKKAEDRILDEGSDVAAKLEEGTAEGIAIIATGGKELLVKSINYLTTVAIQFLLLPFLFIYVVLQIAKRLLSTSVPDSFPKKIVLCLSVGVFISLITVSAKSNEVKQQSSNVENASKSTLINPKSSPILGIDVSHFQSDVNWDEIKAAGISFGYAKATQGANFVDPQFSRNWSDINKNALSKGAYHFYMAGEDPKKQARLFIKTVGKLSSDDMPPMLDLEEGGMKPGIDLKHYREDVFVWLDMVEKALGKKPIIYTDHPFGSKYLTDSKFGEYDLWIADWQKRKEPLVPTAWEGKWTIWQRTERGTIEGEVGNVDHDLFYGSKHEMEKLK